VIVRLPSPEQRSSLELLVSRSERDLAADIAAQEYLTKRGFTEAVAAQWRLGIATSPPVGYERYRSRLVIPYITPTGVVNARFRCLKQHDCKEAGHGKYVGLEGYETSLFNVMDLAKPGDAVCVTEGELDAITLSMCRIPAVAVPGASNWKSHFARCLDDFAKVYVLGDPDTAGKGLNKKLINDVRAIPVTMPGGHDVNSLYLEGGQDALRKLITG
jgi:DNA primase